MCYVDNLDGPRPTIGESESSGLSSSSSIVYSFAHCPSILPPTSRPLSRVLQLSHSLPCWDRVAGDSVLVSPWLQMSGVTSGPITVPASVKSMMAHGKIMRDKTWSPRSSSFTPCWLPLVSEMFLIRADLLLFLLYLQLASVWNTLCWFPL